MQTDVTDPNGNVHRVNFDATGYMTSETLGLGTPQARTFTYVKRSGFHGDFDVPLVPWSQLA